MANYYWVGGNVGVTASYSDGLAGSGSQGTSNYTWLRAFDWNNPLNWRNKVGFGTNIFFATPVDAPGINDVAIFGYEGTEGVSGFQLSTAVAPCLWGGAAGSVHGATWYGAGSLGVDQYGATFASSLYDCQLLPSGGRIGTQYPFKYLGGGLDSDNVINALTNAEARGFTLNSATWQGASWSALVAAAKGMSGGYTRWSKLNLKTRNFTVADGSTGYGPNYFGEENAEATYPNWGIVDVDFIHNRVGSTAAYGMETSCELNGPCEFRLSGYASSIIRNVPTSHHIYFGEIQTISGTGGVGITFTAAVQPIQLGYPTLTLSGITATNVSMFWTDPYASSGLGSSTWTSLGTPGNNSLGVKNTIGSVIIDQTSNVHNFYADPGSNFFTIRLNNQFNSASLFAETTNIGGTVGSTGETLINFDIVSPIYGGEQSNGNPESASPFANRDITQVNYLNGVIIGDSGSTLGTAVNANYLKIGNNAQFSSSGNIYKNTRIPLLFGGAANINRIDCKTVDVAASRQLLDTNFTVKVGELNLSAGSNLRFTDYNQIGNKNFDNWEFGTQDGAVIDGGVVFLDDLGAVYGSNGVRLFNDQLDPKTPRLGDNSTRATSPKQSKTPTVTPTPAP